MDPPHQITGNVRDRFVKAATFLQLLDPVRGKPTAYGLDHELRSLQAPRDEALKRKFLDSFALISATRKDPDSVSAASFDGENPDEPGGTGATVVRIASNAGVSREVLSDLQDISDVLRKIAFRELNSQEGQVDVLNRIIRLDILKIQAYLNKLAKTNVLVEEKILEIESRLVRTLPKSMLHRLQEFLHWLGQILPINKLPVVPDPDYLLDFILWAQKGKTIYPDFLKAAFCNIHQVLPRWIGIIFKIGRYGSAANILVQTALEIPALFSVITVKSIVAPRKASFRTQEEENKPLNCVLRRVQGIDIEEMIPRLARIWRTSDAEEFFRKSCSVDLVTHAELQLISFYDHHIDLKPRFRIIGVSKKSCYLCSVFLAAHPDNFCVSSCHQKLYRSWIPPPTSEVEVYRRYKDITLEMSKQMEAIARQELVTRFDLKRFPVPADSTTGASLTGLTEWRRSEATEFLGHDGIEVNIESASRMGKLVSVSQAKPPETHAFPRTSEAISYTPQSPEIQQAGLSKLNQSTWNRQDPGAHAQAAISSMVLHLKRLGEETKQDIIMMSSIIDAHTQLPSWSKLVNLLNSDDTFGLLYNDSDVLVINKQIQVTICDSSKVAQVLLDKQH